jgi:hypothetical protein
MWCRDVAGPFSDWDMVWFHCASSQVLLHEEDRRWKNGRERTEIVLDNDHSGMSLAKKGTGTASVAY